MKRIALLIVATIVTAPATLAWNAYGHRTITYLALIGLPADAPAWLKDPDLHQRVAYQSNEPDRWRGWPSDAVAHATHPDHYLDVEQLEQFGLTLETLPRLRREYLRAMAIAKHLHPEKVEPYDVSKDSARVYEWPGFALHAIAEHYGRLQASFNIVRILEKLDDPGRKHQLEQARDNAVHEMGLLSHYVGDLAQPLHTTIHHHGWVGDNPNGYTTEYGFHRKIDGAIDAHNLTVESIRPHVKYDRKINAMDCWDDVADHLRRSHALVEPLYQLEADGRLDGPAGKEFITQRAADAAGMLSALYWSAWTSAAPTDEQVNAWVRYNNFDAEERIRGAAAPASE